MTGTKRILYHAVATWPRQIAVFWMAGFALCLLVMALDGAKWVAWVSCVALGFTMSRAIPAPWDVRERLSEDEAAPE